MESMSSEEMVKAIKQIQVDRENEKVKRHNTNNEMTKLFMGFDESIRAISDAQELAGKGVLSSHLEIQKIALKQNKMEFILTGVEGKNGLVSKVSNIEIKMDAIRDNVAALKQDLTVRIAVGSTILSGVCFVIGKLWT